MPPVHLSLAGAHHVKLHQFLHSGDGKEAAAILLCAQRAGDRRYRLVVREVHPIPYAECTVRSATRVSWPTGYIEPLLSRATDQSLSVVKVHSHPNGGYGFSRQDDENDDRFLPSVRDWVERDIPHGSAVMLPDGQMFGRFLDADMQLRVIDCINVAGDDLRFWYARAPRAKQGSFFASHAQAFDEGTIERLRRLSVAVIGVSGTGSPTVEQLARLGVGEIVLVDDDDVEARNLNRILHSSTSDVEQGRHKVEVLAEAVRRMGLGTRVVPVSNNLWNTDVVRTVAQCDVVFGCMDTVDGRYLLNRLATYYVVPYFDVGVRLRPHEGSGRGCDHAIIDVCSRVSYVQPGQSSLMSRGLFTMDQVRAAGLHRQDPAAHDQQAKDGYIAGVAAHRPAVISVNFLASALAVNEFLARLHPFRETGNANHADVNADLSCMEILSDPESKPCETLCRLVGKGDQEPVLGMVELAERQSS